MGLDMYLTRSTYTKRWDHIPPDEQYQVVVTRGGKPCHIISELVSDVEEQLGYWRKANHIHKWFVENVQDGVDDCQKVYVSKGKLELLRDTVDKVLASCKLVPGQVYNGSSLSVGATSWQDNYVEGKVVEDTSVAEALLPTTSGFFFGGTNYDEWYVRDLEQTKEIVERALATDEGIIYYQSSW